MRSSWAEAAVLKATMPMRTSERAIPPWTIRRNQCEPPVVLVMAFPIS
jgi:hypothetical protein